MRYTKTEQQTTETEWLTMSTNVFFDKIDEQTALLYNTNDGKYIVTKDNALIKIINNLYEPENIGSIRVSNWLNKKSKDVKWALDNDIIKRVSSIEKPIILLPILNLQDDITKEDRDGIAGRLRSMASKTKYISGAHIRLSNIIENIDKEKTMNRNHAASQYPCPAYDSDIRQMSLKTLYAILKNLQLTSISVVDIICSSSYFEGTEYYAFERILNSFSFAYRIHMYEDDFNNISKWFNIKKNIIKAELNIYSDVYSEQNETEITIGNDCKIKYIRLVYKESDIVGHEHMALLPVWTWENIEFFKKNVWLNNNDISSTVTNFNSIFRNQKLNANFFGVIDIDTCGNVFSHGAKSLLSNVHEQKFSLAKVVAHEFVENNTWRFTRNLLKNCMECSFRYLCPPVSIPELLCKDTKMCNIEH